MEITYLVIRQNPVYRGEEVIGFVKYTGKDGRGTVEIMNRKATLQPRFLDMGATAKANDNTQAGSHGDGLKVSILVLLRNPQNFALRCCTGGFRYFFDFNTDGRLVARLMRLSKTALKTANEEAGKESKKSQRLVEDLEESCEYVHFMIQGAKSGRDQNGNKTTRRNVTEAEFRQWTKVALFLQECKEKTVTTKGDLIFGGPLRGNLYLKGLNLGCSTTMASASITGKYLEYGYNFINGGTDRDRKSIKTAVEEGRAMALIWNEAIHVNKDLVSQLHRMLNDFSNRQYADISGSRYLTRQTVQRLHGLLMEEAGDCYWYYPSSEEWNVSLVGP